MARLRFDEDMHVHSTFSDGKHSLYENALEAREMGLVRLGCVDHVRRSTTWVPAFVAAVRETERVADLELVAGLEAKLLDSEGALDIPDDAHLADHVYAADHQMPVPGGVLHPAAVRALLEGEPERAPQVVQGLVDAYLNAMRRHGRLVLAHPFSILPKVGLSEDDVTDAQLAQLVERAFSTGTRIEVDERWACPGVRVVRAFMDGGVRVLSSTDSHQKKNIGRYSYLRTLAGRLNEAA